MRISDHQRRWMIPALVILISAAALSLRMGLLGAAPEFDELYHLLAARGWVESGRPAILDGLYTRGRYYTGAVAALFAATGAEDLVTGRWLSVVAGCLVPVVLFLWVRRVAGLPIALVAAGFAVFWPQGILESQFVRFYALQVLFYLGGAAAIHVALEAQGWRRAGWLALCAALWLAALHLQVSTIIGIGAVLAALLLIAIHDHLPSTRRRVMALAGLAAAGGAVLAIAAATGWLDRAWAFYRWAPLHNAELRDYYGFYHANFRRFYGLLWWSTPVLAALAWWARPRLTIYCLVPFSIGFLVHSFGGMKAFRYLSYMTPFLFVIWACGLVAAGRLLAGYLPVRHNGPVAALGLAALVLAMSGFVPQSLRLATGRGIPDRGSWASAADVLGDWRDAPFFMTTRELHMLAYVGPYDLLISPSRLSEMRDAREFAVDPRTGRPIVADAAAVTHVLNCHREGVLVTSPTWWFDWQWGGWMLANFAQAELQVESRADDHVMAVRWYDPAGRPGQGCAALPGELSVPD